MDFEVVWTEQAASDLEDVFTFIAQHNSAAAERTIREIRARANLLRVVPFMGPQYPDDETGQVRTIVSGKIPHLLPRQGE